jgi:holo-[acyl-carrier protein] synthase
MKILGIGVDIIENNRIKKSIQNNKFKTRVYSSNELKLSKNVKNKVAYFSKRFAAKEAFSKALGTGFSENLNFKDIEIVSDKKGKPKYAKNKKIIKIVQKKYKIKKFNSFLSISDEKDYSIAFVVIDKKI